MKLNFPSIFALQEDGWVVCRVFKKKNHQRGNPPESTLEDDQLDPLRANGCASMGQKQNFQLPCDFSFDNNSMHLPQLLSSESTIPPLVPPASMNVLNLETSQNLMKLASTNGGGGLLPQEKFTGDWSILDKLLASHQNLDQLIQSKCHPSSQIMDMSSSVQRFPFQNLGCEADLLKFSKVAYRPFN